MPTNDSSELREIGAEVAAELALADASYAQDALGQPQSEWLFDPIDIDREEIGLRSLLGAVQNLQAGRSDGTDRMP